MMNSSTISPPHFGILRMLMIRNIDVFFSSLWEHANKVLIKVIGKFVKLPQLFHFFVVNDLH